MIMKKTVWLALILMLLCVFALSACDSADTPPNNDNFQQTTDENGDNNSPENPTVCQHTFGEWDTVKQATCKEEGKRTRTCNKCSETEEESIQKSETHTTVIDEAVPATCKDTGLTEGSHCSVCNKVLVEQVVTYKTDVHTPAKEQDGIVSCSICNKMLEDNNLYTVTFKLGSNTLKEISLKSGATITVPTPGANKWYVWNDTIPNKMPAQNITFSAIAIGGDAWAHTTWEYDFNGKLSIHGKGNMSKFSEESQPWAAYKSEITSIIFDSTITGIGKYAFFGCNRLTKVVIPDSIITIGDYAFANCDSIREITIGSKVTSIGTGAFVSSYNLECVIVRGSLNWQVKQDNYSTNITFSARDKYDNASIFKEYSAGKFTVC